MFEHAAVVCRIVEVLRDAVAPEGHRAARGDREVEAAAADVVRGSSLGRYIVLDRVGEGGMGIVYTAYDPELNRRVAIKLVRAVASKSTSAKDRQARLLREAQAMARLSHPNVIAVHDVGTYGEQVFIAMELVDGTTLKEWLKQARRSWREIVEVFLAAGKGLAAAHAAGLVHRDFKPSNVLVGKDGRVRVMDFGVARPVSTADDKVPGESPFAEVDVALTRVGSVVGTPRYMAPEQRGGQPVDPRSDQFSFCASLYEALYGESALAAERAASQAHGSHEAPAGSSVPRWVKSSGQAISVTGASPRKTLVSTIQVPVRSSAPVVLGATPSARGTGTAPAMSSRP